MPDPLLNRVDRDQLPEDLRAIWDEGMRRSGEAAIIEVFANAPELLEWYFNSFYRKVFYEGRVDVRTKELLRLKLSHEHGCYFCNNFNAVDAHAAGVTREQIDALFDLDNPVHSDRDRAVLRLCDEMKLTNMSGELTPDLYAALKRYFSDAQIVELGLTMAVLTGVAKWIFVYDMVTREDNCPVVPGGGSARTS